MRSILIVHLNLGTYDFIGLNSYTANNIYDATRQTNGRNASSFTPLSFSDNEVNMTSSPHWPLSGDGFRRFAPWGLREILKWIKNEYDNPPVFVTENGFADTNVSLSDTWRIDFFEQSINILIYQD